MDMWVPSKGSAPGMEHRHDPESPTESILRKNLYTLIHIISGTLLLLTVDHI